MAEPWRPLAFDCSLDRLVVILPELLQLLESASCEVVDQQPLVLNPESFALNLVGVTD
jgi:hypothetical protein